KKELEIGLWLHTLEVSRESLRELNSKLELARTQYDGAGEAIDGLEQEIEEIAQQAQRIAAQIEEVRRGAQALEEEAARCDGDAAVLRNDIYHNTDNISRLQEEIEQSRAGGQEFDREIARLLQEVEEKRTAIAAAEKEQRELSEQMQGLSRSSDEVSGQMEALSKQASDIALKIADIRVKGVTSESSLQEITLRLSQLTAGAAVRASQNEAAKKEAAECAEALRACEEKVESLQNAVKGYELRYQSRASRLEAAKQEADRLGLDAEEKRRRARLLADLERNMEGFAGSVKTVMRQAERGTLRGIRGPVTRLIETAADTALAVETALGAAAQNIVVENEDNAKRAIQYLKDNNGGRATFLPLTSVKGSLLAEPGLPAEPGFVGIAADLVKYDAEYEGAVRSLLGRTAVAEDMDYAVAIARRYRYRFRVVTLDGQVVNAGGSLTGGSSVKSAGLLSRRAEIEKIEAQAASLAAKAEKAREAWKAAGQEAAAAEAALSGTRGELATAQEDRIRFEGELRRLSEQAQAGEKAAQEAAAEMQELGRRAEECRRLAGQAQEEAGRAEEEKAAVEEKLAALTGGRQELAEQREALSARVTENKLRVLTLHKEIEAAEAAAETLRARQADAAGRQEALLARIAELEGSNADIEARIAALSQEAEDRRARAAQTAGQVEALVARRAEGEQKQTELRRLSREKADEREQAGREIARLEEKAAAVEKDSDDVIRRLYEEYELTRMEAEAAAKPIEDAGKANRRLSELKGKIRALGSVNVDAIEEYKEVSERYEFLSAQVKDVEVSRDELLKLIGELTVQMREIFLDRFNQINYHYGEVFAELFGGGKADLKLTDPDDILHSGIEMHVQPPGKVILNMDALSGGEKALAAIALLFAILKVSPSPFCVLDEIEAALDDVNVDRYAAYLRRMSDKTQFIVITHRRGTMEEADVLYGVTMQEQGVSKLLELRASEVEEKLGLSASSL
ncbi:MAG TPA: chromosome segregation protein SMC, partial [Firmicutes bacterium]|nr:chromosome segregation protein SMC [Bacillota bacterium]